MPRHVTRLETEHENLLDIEQEALTIDRTVKNTGGRDLVTAQGGQEGHGLPMAMWYAAN